MLTRSRLGVLTSNHEELSSLNHWAGQVVKRFEGSERNVKSSRNLLKRVTHTDSIPAGSLGFDTLTSGAQGGELICRDSVDQFDYFGARSHWDLQMIRRVVRGRRISAQLRIQ